MGYELHIKRESGIALTEWKMAVASVPGLRLDDGPVAATNRRSGERIVVFGREGDVAILLEDEWVKVFHFFEGRVNFKAGLDTGDRPNPITQAAFALADILGAKVVGDEGEEYR